MSNEITNISAAQPATAPQRLLGDNKPPTRAGEVFTAGAQNAGRQQLAGTRQEGVVEQRLVADALPATEQRQGGKSSPAGERKANVVELKAEMQRIFRDIDISLDPDLGDVVVRVVDRETGKLVRQIPSEDLMELARNLHELREQEIGGEGASVESKGTTGTVPEGLLIHTKA